MSVVILCVTHPRNNVICTKNFRDVCFLKESSNFSRKYDTNFSLVLNMHIKLQYV